MASASISGERFDIGRVLGTTFSAITGNLPVLGGFAAATGLVSAIIGSFTSVQTIKTLDPNNPASILATFTSPLYWVAILVGLLIGSFTQAGLFHGLVAREHGKAISFMECVSSGLRMFFPLLGLTILWWLGVGLGLVLIYVPGLILMTMWSVSAPVLIAEECGVIAAFGRSRALTKGLRWPIFGTILVFLVIYIFVTFAFQGFSTMGMLNLYKSNMFLGTAVALVMSTVLSLLMTSFLAALYREVTLVKEGGGSSSLAEIFS
jgi:hypothetical protein